MHGVGHVFVNRSFERFGFRPFVPVKEQQNPDPEFPSVKFPNPEEAGTSHISTYH
jgi:phosphoglucomutase